MEYNIELLEVNDLASDMIVPIFVDSNGDWPGAVLAAARCDRAEVNIITGPGMYCVTVYSDDYDLYSSPWWAEQIQARRRYLGR